MLAPLKAQTFHFGKPSLFLQPLFATSGRYGHRNMSSARVHASKPGDSLCAQLMDRFSAAFTDSSDGNPVPVEPVLTEDVESWFEANGEKQASQWLQATNFKAKPGDVRTVPNFENPSQIGSVVIGMESLSDHWSAAALAGTLQTGVYYIDEDSAALSESDATRLALGWGLGSYSFDRYKKEDEEKRQPQLRWPKNCNRSLVTSYLEGIYLARDLIDTPASDMGPKEIADNILEIAKMHGATTNVIVGDDLLAKGYPAVHTVGRASSKPPHLVDLRWSGSTDENCPKIALVGKGVAFDTGGLNLKPGASMIGMKRDMGGAAMMTALAHMIMSQKMPVNLRLMVPTVENSVSGNSYRPSDVLQTRSGLTVENLNTDAEGRLILCDALYEASQDSPDILIDAATLTGAARVALGELLPALYCDDSDVANEILAEGISEDDQMWRMPLYTPLKKKLDSKIAYIGSCSTGPGGSITAALFLKEFVKDAPLWVHIDTGASTPGYIAGPGRKEGGEVLGVRALFQFLQKKYGKKE